MMNDYTNLIIEGIQIVDQIGGPSELAKILTDSLTANKQFNEHTSRRHISPLKHFKQFRESVTGQICPAHTHIFYTSGS